MEEQTKESAAKPASPGEAMAENSEPGDQAPRDSASRDKAQGKGQRRVISPGERAVKKRYSTYVLAWVLLLLVGFPAIVLLSRGEGDSAMLANLCWGLVAYLTLGCFITWKKEKALRNARHKPSSF